MCCLFKQEYFNDGKLLMCFYGWLWMKFKIYYIYIYYFIELLLFSCELLKGWYKKNKFE